MQHIVHDYVLNDFEKVFSADSLSMDDYCHLEINVESWAEALAVLLFAIPQNSEEYKNVRHTVYERGGRMSMCGNTDIGSIQLAILSAENGDKRRPVHLAYIDLDGDSQLDQRMLSRMLSSENIWASYDVKI